MTSALLVGSVIGAICGPWWLSPCMLAGALVSYTIKKALA